MAKKKKQKTKKQILAWLKRAKSTDDARPKLTKIHTTEGRAIACDGFRMHIWNYDTLYADDLEIEPVDGYPDFISILNSGKQGQIRGKVSKYHLTQACKAAGVFAKEAADSIRLEFSDTLKIIGKAAELGEAQIVIENGDMWRGGEKRRIVKTKRGRKLKWYDGKEYIATYEINGDHLDIAFNYKYLMKALSGMNEIVEFTLSDKSSPIYLESGQAEAIIMPMHLGR